MKLTKRKKLIQVIENLEKEQHVKYSVAVKRVAKQKNINIFQ